MTKTWVELDHNLVLRGCGDEYYVSYYGADRRNPLGDAASRLLAAALGMEYDGGPETALVVRGDGGSEYYILMGDFRSEYERLDSLEECMAFFQSRPELWSYMSDKPPGYRLSG